MAANARINASVPMQTKIMPAVCSRPASQPDSSCHPAGFSSLLISKNRFVPAVEPVSTLHHQTEQVSKKRTRVSLPIKVVLRIAVAFEFESQILSSRTMCKWDMVISNVVEEVNLVLSQKKTGSNRVNGCIAPPLIEEATISVERVEEVNVSLRPEEVKVANLEVRPLGFD